MELNENIRVLVESERYSELNEAEKSYMGLMLNNAEKEAERVLAEGTVASDIAQFTPIIMPLVRRVYPNLIANELVGVQPMAQPTGFVYALVNRYVGSAANGEIDPVDKGQILELDIAVSVGDDLTGQDAGGNSADATVVYVEGNSALVSVSGNFLVAGSVTDNTTSTSGNVTAVYTNEASFGQILENYTGPYATAQAEKLGEDMNEVGFDVARKAIEAKSRALKGRYSVEMYQDLKSQHGLAADEELMNLMSYEIQAELDREIVNFVNTNSTPVPNGTPVASVDGRWEIEKYRAEVVKLKKEANMVGIATKRGKANIAVVSPSVATMLQEVGGFTIAKQDSTVRQPVAGGVAGVFDNQIKVVVDQYAKNNYATVLYKGADRRDAMGFFAPYVPLSFTKVTKFETGQPAIIAKTRYALETVPGIETAISNDRAKLYARSYGIDFTGTQLEG